MPSGVAIGQVRVPGHESAHIDADTFRNRHPPPRRPSHGGEIDPGTHPGHVRTAPLTYGDAGACPCGSWRDRLPVTQTPDEAYPLLVCLQGIYTEMDRSPRQEGVNVGRGVSRIGVVSTAGPSGLSQSVATPPAQPRTSA